MTHDQNAAEVEIANIDSFQDAEPEELRIQVLPGEESTSASFQILDEDHTLGNALRYIIMKNPLVEFCGYSIPHPSENQMNIRIQIYHEYGDVARPVDALLKGLDDLGELCNLVRGAFIEQRGTVESIETEDNNQ